MTFLTLDRNLTGNREGQRKACAGICAGSLLFDVATRIVTVMRFDAHTNSDAAILLSGSGMAVPLASTPVRNRIEAEFEVAATVAKSFSPVIRPGKI